MDIDVVVVNYKTYPLIRKFVDSYYKFMPKIVNSHLIVIDNGAESLEQSLDNIKVREGDRVISVQDNIGYSGACNLGAKLGTSEYIGFFNSDCEFINADCIDTCVSYLEDHSNVAVVGPLQYSSAKKVTHGGIFGSHDHPIHRGFGSILKDEYRDVKEAVTVSGSVYITSRKVWDEMENCPIYRDTFPDAEGAWPPFPHFFEETLYSYHVYAHDYLCVYLGNAEIIHQWHKSSPKGSQNNNFKIGQKGFRTFCDNHGIPHD